MSTFDGSIAFGSLIAAKTTLLLLVAFVLSFLARKTSASARHVLWALTFGFLLIVPAIAGVSLVQQEMRIPLAVLSPAPDPVPVMALGEPRAPSRSREELRVNATGPIVAGTRPFSIRPGRVLGIVWAAGGLLLIARLALGFISSRRLRTRAEEVSEPAWIDLLEGARERLDVRQPVALRWSGRVQLPMTLGLFRPAILLPLAADSYSMPRRSAVILHELAHVRRRDLWTQLLSQLASAAFWWNPLVWIAARHMRLLSERASDDLVLDAGARPSDYAHDLLEMARGLHKERANLLGSVTMAHRSRFEERLLAILDPRIARKAVSSRFVLAMGLAALPLALSLALAVPTAAKARKQEVAERVVAPERPEKPEAAAPEAPEVPEAPETPVAPAREMQETKDTPPAKTNAARDLARAALAKALDDPEASVREQALHALIQLEDSSVAPYLEKALSDPEPDARAQAAHGLGQLGRKESAPSLVNALRDSDAEVRAQAAWALGMLESEESVEGLTTALRDAEENVREQAVWALGMIQSRQSVDGLAGALSDSSPDVRQQAAWALGMIGDPGAIEALSRALEDSDANVREQAAWALGQIANNEEGDSENQEPRLELEDDSALQVGDRSRRGVVAFGRGAIL
jgi:HEAT repeat protein/beta-lactamase regulating signal transducer with metallopeptidase domain